MTPIRLPYKFEEYQKQHLEMVDGGVLIDVINPADSEV
jgi:hypothetical protein